MLFANLARRRPGSSSCSLRAAALELSCNFVRLYASCWLKPNFGSAAVGIWVREEGGFVSSDIDKPLMSCRPLHDNKKGLKLS